MIYTPSFDSDDESEYKPNVPEFDTEVYFIASELLGSNYDQDVIEIAIEAAKMGHLEPFSDGSEDDTDDDFEIL
jgi:hypothetical protein